MNKNKRTERLELRVAPWQKEHIQDCARRCGMSVTAFVLQCCFDRQPRQKPPEEFWTLLDTLYELCNELSPEKQRLLASRILELQKAV